jgi:MFS family permease
MPVTRLIRTLQVSTFFISATYGVMFTMLDDYRDEYGISESLLGFVVAIGFFASFFSQLTLAPMADRGHSRRLIVIGFATTILGCLLMAFGTSAPVLIVGRLVMGLGTGMSLPALRRIIIVADPEHLGANMGRLLSVDVAGFAMGPVISVVTVGPLGIPAPFLFLATVLGLMALALSRLDVPETATDDRPTERLAFDLLRHRAVTAAVLIGLALFLMIGTFDSLWAIMMEDLDAPEWMANVGITLFALPMIFLGPYGGRLSQRVGPYRAGAAGMLLGAGFMCLYGLLPSPYMMMGVFLLHTINDGLTVTSAGVAVGIAAPPSRQAGAQGLLGGLQTLIGGVSATAAGWSYDSTGRGTTFVGCAVIMCILVVLGLSLAGDLRSSRQRPEPANLEPAV